MTSIEIPDIFALLWNSISHVAAKQLSVDDINFIRAIKLKYPCMYVLHDLNQILDSCVLLSNSISHIASKQLGMVRMPHNLNFF